MEWRDGKDIWGTESWVVAGEKGEEGGRRKLRYFQTKKSTMVATRNIQVLDQQIKNTRTCK